MLVIDDSFSSNDIGFKDALLQLGKYKKYNRILVTPGIVELGKDESDIHVALGKAIVGNADYVFLVGHSNRTKSLALGIGKNVPILYLDKTLDFMTKVKEIKSDKEPIVLIENDVTANYN
jgi:UDP-N-acetylmuramoyl-tripeptide--D-alanyl-D-alanine ligase